MGKSDWRSRLILEKAQLVERYEALKDFIDTEAFEELDQEDKHLLLLQAHYMQGYLKILEDRVGKEFRRGRARTRVSSEATA